MSEENQSPEELPSQEEKQAALKDKLKDMGVMQDDHQPPPQNDPSFFKSKWFVLSVVAVAIGFWYWYSNAELSEQGDQTAGMNVPSEHMASPDGHNLGSESVSGSSGANGSRWAGPGWSGPGAMPPGGAGYPPTYPQPNQSWPHGQANNQANEQVAETDTTDESELSQAEPATPNRNIPPIHDWRSPPPGYYMPPPPPPMYYGRAYYPPPAYYGRPYYGGYPPPPFPY